MFVCVCVFTCFSVLKKSQCSTANPLPFVFVVYDKKNQSLIGLCAMRIDQWLRFPKTKAEQLENLERVVCGRNTGGYGDGREEYLASTQGRTSVLLPAFHYARTHAHTQLFSNNVGATRQLPFPKLKKQKLW